MKLLHAKNEKAFTLIEVVASLLLITLILLSFSQIFVQANKTSVTNNEKLVVTHLADAELQRLKNEKFSSIDPKLTTPPKSSIPTYNINFESNITLNNQNYKVEVWATQKSAEENNLKIVSVLVSVISPNGKTKSTSEGYLSYE